MGNMRTMAFQVPEELFQKIKDYLQRNNMTQKQFVIGLIENEINRDLAQRQAVNETATESEGQEGTDFSYDFDIKNEASENLDEDEDLDESEDQDESIGMGMAMGM